MSKALRMRLVSFLACLAGLGLSVLACSSDDTPSSSPATSPPNDGGTSSEDGSSSSGGDAEPPAPEAGKPVYVNHREETFAFGGGTRKYILGVPTDYDAGRAYPLVVEMHGNPGSAEYMKTAYPFDGISKREAIIAYANAAGTDWDLTTPKDQNTDLNYLPAMIDDVASKVSIDKQRVLGTGWSGGGFMASQFACRFAGVFKAIAIHAGGAPFMSSDNTPPEDQYGFLLCPGTAIATIVVHGENDTTVSKDSGEYAGTYWAMKNGCSDTLTAATPSPCKKFDGCPAATPVVRCMIPGLGHPMWDQGHAASWEFFKSLP